MELICFGELLVDLIGEIKVNDGNDKNEFNIYAGGSAGNVAVGASKLGVEAGIISRVGDEFFGDFILKKLQEYEVNTSLIKTDNDRKTGLAFVTLSQGKKPSYLFYRDQCASKFTKPCDIKKSHIAENEFLYFSSMSLVNTTFRNANYKALELAQQNDVLTFFDPNLRLDLWSNENEAKREIISMVKKVDMLKISNEELDYLFGLENERVHEIFRRYHNLKFIAVTMGEKGALIINSQKKQYIPPNNVTVNDTTGAGDAFVGAIIAYINKKGSLLNTNLKKLGEYAAAVSELTIQRYGVMNAMPTEKEVQNYINRR